MTSVLNSAKTSKHRTPDSGGQPSAVRMELAMILSQES